VGGDDPAGDRGGGVDISPHGDATAYGLLVVGEMTSGGPDTEGTVS
jgi:hypothetical protein